MNLRYVINDGCETKCGPASIDGLRHTAHLIMQKIRHQGGLIPHLLFPKRVSFKINSSGVFLLSASLSRSHCLQADRSIISTVLSLLKRILAIMVAFKIALAGVLR